MLLLLSVTMFLGSFVSGLIPLTLSLSESKMRFITIIGAGLLVGTALAVIIPEGVHTLYKNNDNSPHDVDKRDIILPIVNSIVKRHGDHNHEHSELLDKLKVQNILDDKETKSDSNDSQDSKSHSHESGGSHSAIGVTLVLGFVYVNCGSNWWQYWTCVDC